MRFRKPIFLLLGIFLLTVVQNLPANELQRLVFNAAGNIGMAEAIVEFQGITPENSNTLNGYINTAIAMLDQLAGQYNDPPFDAGQIRKIADMLRRFSIATEQMNNRGKSSYLQNCYTNLKSAMSVIFRSDKGVTYNSTCDTYVTDLGYHSGLALAASQMGNAFLENLGKSGINQALRMGTMTRGTLGCSFLSEDQARSLNVPNLKTPGEFTQMIRNLENDVRTASLNLEPGFDSPATKGKVAPPVPIDPPPPTPPTHPNDLTGSWQAGRKIISKEGGSYVVRYYNRGVARPEIGFSEGMIVLKFADQRDAAGYYYGKYLIFHYSKNPWWTDATIEHGVHPSGQQFLKIYYTYEGRKSRNSFTRDQR
ncbi:MAG: hypothetical protein MUC72_11105 [Acidobacteria bacterium]|jgi:hypothetical protein|nr:hypothetical protein [Acidobacteriota bacterium]